MNSYLASIPEAQELLGVSRYVIEKAVKSGTLEARELEGRTYIVRATIENFINGNQ